MELNILKSLNLKHAINNTIATIKQLGDSDVCIIVPDKLSATMERLIFEQLDIESSFNINVSTLNRLSKNILAETNANYKTISKIGGIILLKKVLNDNRDLITSFKNTKHSYQYSNEIYKTLAQLKSCQLDSEELLKYVCPIKHLQQKINDLGILLQSYNDAKVGVLDNSDTLTLTCVMLDKSETVKNTYYIFAGFDDFTSQGYLLIERLIKHSKGVYVNTYTSSFQNKNIYYQDVFYRLITLCNMLGIKDNIIENKYIDTPLHTYLTHNLFAFNKLNFITKANDIRMYQAQNITDELEFVARDIRKNILAGARFKQFGIAVYNLQSYTNIIKQIFDKYEICTYLDIQKTFSSTFVYRFFTNLWQLYLKKYDTLNLIEFINSNFIEIPEHHKVAICNTLKQINYRGNLANLDCKDEQVNQSVNILHQFLTQFELNENSTIDDVIDWHTNIATQLNLDQVLTSISNSINDAYEQKIIVQALKSSTHLLDEIKQFYPSSTLAEVYDIYVNAGLELAISPLPLSADCVQIVDANEILTSFDNLYIVNCSATTAPNTLQDVGILLDKELTYVQLSHSIEPTIARMNRLNKFKLFNSALMFNKTLTISMSLSSPSETSPLVNELKSRIFIGDNNQTETNIGYIYPYQIKTQTNYIPLSLWDLVEYVYTNKLQVSDSVDAIIKSSNIGASKTQVSVDKKHVDFNQISASALETYFQCPLQYFFNYILKLKEPVSSEIEMLDIGNILHKLAQLYYLQKDKQSLNIPEFCRNTIYNLINSDEKLKSNINNPILINLIDEAVRFVLHLQELDNNSKFIPTYFEKSFGLQKDFTALPLTDKISLKGQVDRIDLYDNHFRIIDYKSGNADATFAELYYGKKLQLFLYALAIKNATNLIPSGTFYLPIQNVVEKSNNNDSIYKLTGFYTDNNDLATAYDINILTNLKSNFVNMTLKKDGTLSKRSDKVLTPSQMDLLMNYAKDLSAQALKEISSGNFNASPLKFNKQKYACKYCPHLVLCSKNSNNIPFRDVGKVSIDSFKNNLKGGINE